MDAKELKLKMYKIRGKFFRMRHRLLEDMSEMKKTMAYYRYLRDWEISLQRMFDEIMPMQLKLTTLLPDVRFAWNTIARLYDEMIWKIRWELISEPQNCLYVNPRMSVVKLQNYWLESISIAPVSPDPVDTTSTQTNGNEVAKICNNYTTVSEYMNVLLSSPIMSYMNNILSKEILDLFKNNLTLLDNLNSPDNLYNVLAIHIILSKLNQSVRKQCVDKLTEIECCPTWKDCIEILEEICDVQETKLHEKRKKLRKEHLLCMHCSKKGHHIWECRDLKAMRHDGRRKRIEELELCLNCFQKDHPTTDCNSANRCKLCSKTHHTILHPDENAIIRTETNIKNKEKLFPLAFITPKGYPRKHVLYPTAIVKVLDADGNYYKCRAILTKTVNANFITKKLKNKLQLNTENSNIELVDLFGDNSSSTKYASVTTSVTSLQSDFTLKVELLVTEVIQPKNKYHINKETINIPKNLRLADPHYNYPKNIDILLGAEAFNYCLTDGVMRIFENAILLQNTEFGWTLDGVVDYADSSEDIIIIDD